MLKNIETESVPLGLGGSQNLKSPKVLNRLLKVSHNVAFECMRVLIKHFFNSSVLKFL